MNTTTTAGEPPYTTTADTRVTVPYGLGFFFVIIFLLITLCYGSYIYKSRIRSQPPPPPSATTTTAFSTTTNHHHADDNNHRLITCSQGLDEDVLVTFPTFVYSEAMMPHKEEAFTVVNNSGCAICLSEYKAADVVRLLPECGHLFHVSCVDTWLKVHPTCPVCRNSPLPPV